MMDVAVYSTDGIIVNFHGEKNNRGRVSPTLFVNVVRYENSYFLSVYFDDDIRQI